MPGFSFLRFLYGGCVNPLKAVAAPELVRPHGSPTTYIRCGYLIHLFLCGKAAGQGLDICHPILAELSGGLAVALDLRLSNQQCRPHTPGEPPTDPSRVLFPQGREPQLLYPTEVND